MVCTNYLTKWEKVNALIVSNEMEFVNENIFTRYGNSDRSRGTVKFKGGRGPNEEKSDQAQTVNTLPSSRKWTG